MIRLSQKRENLRDGRSLLEEVTSPIVSERRGTSCENFARKPGGT